ncbi:MAG: hypothetical protein P4L46_00635 [Fimbriimonas sp.]|nr:hypothetical protein [Fimbriimonas sp.]
MKSWAEDQYVWNEAQRLLDANMLKQCPLCRAINAASNSECFVCGWRGKFTRDRAKMETEVHSLLDRCPELARALIEGTDSHAPKPGLLSRIFEWVWARIRTLKKVQQ